ncbi:Stf0 family sulfotransferase [Mesorhizobium sp. STM 4661]|uniref:Stf0 family sulfotransferase n=1 Tax=Mesorhizobium sp. STM 4661 TaxID=1297570 RepID=UPI0002BFBE71|nr:Stf0 family sulfotransferase [Mesorhizobium sp. STM 4661]CCV16096.1 putative Stf0 sulphotransferase [Mesorhizobium sp. STM 4661]
MPISPPESWERPSKTLIIASTPRSGSNLLCNKVCSTGVLGNPGEYFHHWDAPEVTTVDRCLLAASKGKSENGVVAFKLFPEHFDRLQKDIRLTEWFPDPVWVLLERRDLLGQAISLAKAMQDGAWTSGEHAVKDAEYTVEGIEAALAKIIAGNGRWSAYFARSGIEPLHIFYEDIHDDFDSACQRMGRLLGLEAPVPATAQVDMQQQRNAQNDDWRRRFLAEAGDRNSFPAALNPMGNRARKKTGWRFWRR